MIAADVDLLKQALALLACVVIVWRAEPALNRCGRDTTLSINVAIWLLHAVALLSAYDILTGDVPPWIVIAGGWGVAMMLLCERRIRILLRPVRPRRTAGEGR